MSPPTFEEIFNELSMSGRVVVEESAKCIRLKKKTYPLLTFLWCTGIMGGIVYAFYRFSGDSGLTIAGAIISVVLVTTFTALSVYSDRKPPIVELDRATEILTVPRFPELRFESKDIVLRLIPASVDRYNHRTHSQILAVVSGAESREIPIYCENLTGLKRPAKTFAEKASIEYEICHKRKIRIS